jgi:SAM-dependent methyltransferase
MTTSISFEGSSNNLFHFPSEKVRNITPPELPMKFLWEFLLDGRTPARAMTDEAMQKLLPALEGSGTIIELGAGGDYYRRLAKNGQRYVTSNLSEGCDKVLDMTNLDLPDNTVDAFVSVFAIEHLVDFDAVFREQLRALKPGGRLLVVAPFLYYYHAAPDDFFRFTASALDKLLTPFDVLVRQPIGGRWLLFAEFLHEKTVMGSRLGYFGRLALRWVALPFLVFALKQNDPKYALGFAYICEKRNAQ